MIGTDSTKQGGITNEVISAGQGRATYKQEVVASRAVVASNHPLASTAGVEMLTRGGNAVDAAVATLFALSVVEPMMVSPWGAGFFLIRDGRTGQVTFLDNYAAVPNAATPDMYDPIPGDLEYGTRDGANVTGYRSIATPGALAGWAAAAERFGRLPWATLLGPAIRYAAEGFTASDYLIRSIRELASDLARFPDSAATFLPNGRVPAVGQHIVRSDYARTLRQIAEEGAATMYTGALARAIVADLEANSGLVTLEDLAEYRVIERAPVRGTYRGYDIVSTAPPSSGGTHIVQLLNLLEGFQVGQGGLAFGQPGYVHVLAEGLKITFADRRRYMADPDRVAIPVDALTSKAYAERRRAEINPARAREYAPGAFSGIVAPAGADLQGPDAPNTTHCTVIDHEGTIVSATQTLQTAFGSKVTVPGTGMLLSNHLSLMDPTPGNTNSIEPGKRVLSSMSPTIVMKDGRPFLALGTPGGKRIYGAVAQAILNVIDHGMSAQEAFEAPRAWTQGRELEIESGFPNLTELRSALEALGHRVAVVEKVAGGMNGVLVDAVGRLHGAACWRADGVPIGVSGGSARPSASLGIPT
ncbi:MAG: gamma-glutamyltransferase [Chloroflexi bacterium]|nr:gamma-glutamyltransferase [Chloroflexota bacterium]